jgi:hypothetical protein
MKRLLPLLAAIGLAVAACGGEMADTTTTTAATTTTTAAPTTTPVAAVEDDIESLIAVAEEVRGLEFLDPPTVTFLPEEEMADRIRARLDEELDPEEVAVDEALFELLGLIPSDLDLVTAYTDLLAEQVAGFYDPDTRELVVMGSADATALTKTIVVHELIHALTDQHFGWGADFDAFIEEERFHEAVSLQALIEGDATYFQIVYLQSLPTAEQIAAARESLAADTSIFDSLPSFMGADLAFPYDTGFRFVERIVADQGIGGVDQAYELPPTTTEQVIRPNAYFTLEPGLPVEVGVSLPGWTSALSGTFGQFNLQNYLFDGVDGGTATIAADGWGGDAYEVFVRDDDVALALRYFGDTPRDAAEVYDALVESLPAMGSFPAPTRTAPGSGDEPAPATASFGSIGSMELLGSELVLVVATDPDAVVALADQLSLG